MKLGKYRHWWRYGNIVLLPAVVTLFALAAVFYSYLLYRMVHPPVPPELTPEYHGLPYSEVRWKNRSGVSMKGWFIPGARGTPLIILCHGYESNRSEVLDLAATLKEKGAYNVLVFNLRGHDHAQPSRTSLGLYEKTDVLSTIDFALSMPDIEPKIGLWGVSVGGYAALAAATESGRVAAVAVDSVYPDVKSFIDIQTQHLLRNQNRFLCEIMSGFYAAHFLVLPTRVSEPIPLEKLNGTAVLYITGTNSPALAALTRTLYADTQTPKDILPLGKSRDKSGYEVLFGSEKRLYDERVLEFFRKTMPVGGFVNHKRKI